MRALIVDDDAGVRLLLRRILLRNQFEVDLARDGAEAIAMIAQHEYGVIVLDLMMPRIDGRAVVRYFARYAPEKLRNVIVMSAFAEALEEVCPPVMHAIEKPFDIDRVLREIAHITPHEVGEDSGRYSLRR